MFLNFPIKCHITVSLSVFSCHRQEVTKGAFTPNLLFGLVKRNYGTVAYLVQLIWHGVKAVQTTGPRQIGK